MKNLKHLQISSSLTWIQFQEKTRFNFLLGDFNAKLSEWCKNDSPFYKGIKIDGIRSQFGM